MLTHMLDTNLDTNIFNALIHSQPVHTRDTHKPSIYLAKVDQKTALLHVKGKYVILHLFYQLL